MSDIFAGIRRYAENWNEEQIEHGKSAAVEMANLGAELMQDRIHAAETEWGRARQAGTAWPGKGARQFAGRIEDGDMIAAVDSRIVSEGSDFIEVAWGWEDPEDYHLYQEHGTDSIAPMESIAHSLDIVEDGFDARLRGIGSW